MHKSLKSQQMAFTLIELMMVIIIIGILAAVAVPAYKAYVVRVKMADAYVTIDAIQKKEITHFYDRGSFIGLVLGYTGNPYTQTGGTKFAIQPQGSSPFLNSIIAENSFNYFAYDGVVGFINSSGQKKSASYTSEGVYEENISGYSFPMIMGGFRVYQGSTYSNYLCDSISVKAEDLGIQSIPNEHWFLVLAGADFKPNPPCTKVFGALRAYNGEIFTRPMITLNVGE